MREPARQVATQAFQDAMRQELTRRIDKINRNREDLPKSLPFVEIGALLLANTLCAWGLWCLLA